MLYQQLDTIRRSNRGDKTYRHMAAISGHHHIQASAGPAHAGTAA